MTQLFGHTQFPIVIKKSFIGSIFVCFGVE